MSYGITGYKLQSGNTVDDFRKAMVDGEDEYQAADFAAEEQGTLHDILIAHGFRQTSPKGREYEREAALVEVINNQIWFTIPYWDDAKDDFELSMRVIVEMHRKTGVVFWDSQEDAVITDKKIPALGFMDGVEKVKQIAQRHQQTPATQKPWWKLW